MDYNTDLNKGSREYAFLFPGAGMNFEKYISLFLQRHKAEIPEIAAHVKKQTGIDVADNIYAPPDSRNCADTIANQLALYSISNMVYRDYLKAGFRPSLFLSFSMGIYAAFHCAGAITFEQGIDIILNAYRFLTTGLSGKVGAMGVIIGLTNRDVEGLIKVRGLQGKVDIANETSEHETIVSGLEEDVDLIIEAAVLEGALKTVKLNLTIPYHSKINEDACEEFYAYLKTLHFNDLTIPLISSVTGNLIRAHDQARQELYLNLKNNISWKNAVEKADSLGYRNFAEAGTGDSLIKITKLTCPEAEYVSYKTMEARD